MKRAGVVGKVIVSVATEFALGGQASPLGGMAGLWLVAAGVNVVPSRDTSTSSLPGASKMSRQLGCMVTLLTFTTCFMSTVKNSGNCLGFAFQKSCWFRSVDHRVWKLPSNASAGMSLGLSPLPGKHVTVHV